MSDHPQNTRFGAAELLTSGILLSVLTGVAYLTVYAYDLGYCGYFQISHDFISIAPANLLAAAVALLLVGTCLGALSQPLLRLMKNAAKAFFLIASIVTLAALAQTLLQPQLSAVARFVSIIVIVVYILFIIGVGFLSFAPRPWPWSSFESNASSTSKVFGNAILLGPALSILLYVLALTGGGYFAAFRAEFPVTVEPKPKVLLAIFGNEAITADYQAATHTVGPAITLYPIDKLPSVRQENTGRLIYTKQP